MWERDIEIKCETSFCFLQVYVRMSMATVLLTNNLRAQIKNMPHGPKRTAPNTVICARQVSSSSSSLLPPLTESVTYIHIIRKTKQYIYKHKIDM